MVIRFSLKELYRDLKKVKSSTRLKSKKKRKHAFGFGNKLDEFIYTGPFMKQTNRRDSGFYTEFQLLTGGIYNSGSRPDVHLSIIDARGYAVAHVTFKPDGVNGVAFHYGIKTQDQDFPEFWVTRPYKNKGRYDEMLVESQMEQTYNFVIKHILVIRRDDYGNEIERYPFHPLGTVGRIENTPQKLAAQEIKRKRASTPGGISLPSAKRGLMFTPTPPSPFPTPMPFRNITNLQNISSRN